MNNTTRFSLSKNKIAFIEALKTSLHEAYVDYYKTEHFDVQKLAKIHSLRDELTTQMTNAYGAEGGRKAKLIDIELNNNAQRHNH